MKDLIKLAIDKPSSTLMILGGIAEILMVLVELMKKRES